MKKPLKPKVLLVEKKMEFGYITHGLRTMLCNGEPWVWSPENQTKRPQNNSWWVPMAPKRWYLLQLDHIIVLYLKWSQFMIFWKIYFKRIWKLDIFGEGRKLKGTKSINAIRFPKTDFPSTTLACNVQTCMCIRPELLLLKKGLWPPENVM